MTTRLEQINAAMTFSKMFTGTNEESGAACIKFLSGELDEALIDFGVNQGHDESIVRANIEDNKVRFRNQIMKAVKELEKQDIENVKGMHKPSKNGTTAEIAAHLNMSKSEVRKLRREGKLDEVFEESL